MGPLDALAFSTPLGRLLTVKKASQKNLSVKTTSTSVKSEPKPKPKPKPNSAGSRQVMAAPDTPASGGVELQSRQNPSSSPSSRAKQRRACIAHADSCMHALPAAAPQMLRAGLAWFLEEYFAMHTAPPDAALVQSFKWLHERMEAHWNAIRGVLQGNVPSQVQSCSLQCGSPCCNCLFKEAFASCLEALHQLISV